MPARFEQPEEEGGEAVSSAGEKGEAIHETDKETGQTPLPQPEKSTPHLQPATNNNLSTDELNLKKLLLEIRDLEEKTSLRGRVSQYAKLFLDAFIPIAAIVGIVITVTTTKHQWDAQSRDVLRSRYQAAYTALGSSTAAQRITGAYLLTDLLGADSSRDTEVLRALVDALAGESDANVRLTLKRLLTDYRASKQAKSAALEEVISRQNGLQAESQLTSWQLAMARKDQEGWLVPDARPLSWRRSGEEIWAYPTEKQQLIIDQLTDLGYAFVFIYSSGGRTKQMSGLFIRNFRLDLFRKEEVADARFDNAILPFCDLSGAHLPRANFNGALLIGTNFSGADLRGASFSNTLEDPISQTLARLEPDWSSLLKSTDSSAVSNNFPQGPSFTNAQLDGAKFIGNLFTILHLTGSSRNESVALVAPDFTGASLNNAHFEHTWYTSMHFTPNAVDDDPRLIEYAASYPQMRGRMALFYPDQHAMLNGTIATNWPSQDVRVFTEVISRSGSFQKAYLPSAVNNQLMTAHGSAVH